METNVNLVKQIYNRATGHSAAINLLHFKHWCDTHVAEWKQRTEALGYSWPCWCVGNVSTGTETYHEWLDRKYS